LLNISTNRPIPKGYLLRNAIKSDEDDG
jgi:hypothetical protein